MPLVNLSEFETAHMTSMPRTNRVRVLELDVELLVEMFVPGAPNRWYRCSDGLPEGARPIAVAYDPIQRVLRILVEHESFDEVLQSEVVPSIWATFSSWTQAPGQE